MVLTLPSAENVKKAAILCHRHADADTYLSAYALSYMIGKLMPAAEVSIIIPDGMSSLTQKLAESFPHTRHEESQEYDLLVAVDIGHTELLADWNEKLRRSAGV